MVNFVGNLTSFFKSSSNSVQSADSQEDKTTEVALYNMPAFAPLVKNPPLRALAFSTFYSQLDQLVAHLSQFVGITQISGSFNRENTNGLIITANDPNRFIPYSDPLSIAVKNRKGESEVKEFKILDQLFKDMPRQNHYYVQGDTQSPYIFENSRLSEDDFMDKLIQSLFQLCLQQTCDEDEAVHVCNRLASAIQQEQPMLILEKLKDRICFKESFSSLSCRTKNLTSSFDFHISRSAKNEIEVKVEQNAQLIITPAMDSVPKDHPLYKDPVNDDIVECPLNFNSLHICNIDTGEYQIELIIDPLDYLNFSSNITQLA